MEQFTAASLGVTPFYVENAMIHSISMENALIQIQTSPKKQAETGHLGLGIVFWIMIWLGHFIFSKFNPQNIDNFHRKKFSILWFWSLGENLISGDFVAEARIALLNHYEGVGMGKFVHHYHNQESTYINTWFICIRITIAQSSCYLASKDVGEKKPEATNNRFPWNFHRPATDGIKFIIIRIKKKFFQMYIFAVGIETQSELSGEEINA